MSRSKNRKRGGRTREARWRDIWVGKSCHYCSAPAEGVDHVIPRALGGPNAQWNLMPACGPCNQSKAAQWPPTCSCSRCTFIESVYRTLIRNRVDSPTTVV